MRKLTALALIALAAGIALLGYSVATGESQVHLFLIFPVFTGTGVFAFLGIVLIAVAMFVGFFSFAGATLVPSGPPPKTAAPPAQAPQAAPPARKFGGVVFLGPIPIVFGSDARVSKWMLILGIALTVLLIAFFFLVLAGLQP